METLLIGLSIIGGILIIGFAMIKLGEFKDWLKDNYGDKIERGIVALFIICITIVALGIVVTGIGIGGIIGVVLVVVGGFLVLYLIAGGR